MYMCLYVTIKLYLYIFVWDMPVIAQCVRSLFFFFLLFTFLVFVYFCALSFHQIYTFTHPYNDTSVLTCWRNIPLYVMVSFVLSLNLRQPKLHWAGFSDLWLLYDLYFVLFLKKYKLKTKKAHTLHTRTHSCLYVCILYVCMYIIRPILVFKLLVSKQQMLTKKRRKQWANNKLHRPLLITVCWF